MIIGLTGSCCSGKDTVADYIRKKHGYMHLSLSDVIREMMKIAKIESTRENLIAFGTKLRRENGNGVLAEKILEKIDLNGKYCITSIRHPDEVKILKKIDGFVLINIDAPEDIRFERMQKRKRLGDPKTLKKFIELEEQESQIEGPGQQLSKTSNMADITLVNASNSVAKLGVAIENLLKNIEK
ncbi:MAG: AAA family ATPase [Endomicrobium sp.]|jgi:dephospho-CoA kinase|nr:AAA family ATPase [Endomicrobium sp.]